jgi:hypothetical protein
MVFSERALVGRLLEPFDRTASHIGSDDPAKDLPVAPGAAILPW